MSVRMRLPVFMVADADPHGIEIFLTYKFGSRTMAHQSHELACTSLKWLGIRPSDFDKWRLPREALVPLRPEDLRKAEVS
jgi:meiotic recombination protein SPO11